MLLAKYPGLLRGMARLAIVEEIQRAAAMLPIEEEINGMPVMRMTPRHYDQLSIIRTPFFITPELRRKHGIHIQPHEVGQFLWVISPLNPQNQRSLQRIVNSFTAWLPFLSQKSRFLRMFRRAPRYLRFERAIDRYYSRMFFDQPPRGNGGIVAVAPSVSFVNRIAGAYGWPDEVLDILGHPIPGKGVLDMPIPRLFQYWRWITADRDSSIPRFSRMRDTFKTRLIAKYAALAKAAGFENDPPPTKESSASGRPWRDATEKYLISIGKLPGDPEPNDRVPECTAAIIRKPLT